MNTKEWWYVDVVMTSVEFLFLSKPVIFTSKASYKLSDKKCFLVVVGIVNLRVYEFSENILLLFLID